MPRLHIAKSGRGRSLALLPPAPHTGAFFDDFVPALDGMEALCVDYPGYGGSENIPAPSICGYAEAIAPHLPDGAALLGFHTGTLVAVEIARRMEAGAVILVDIPAFDACRRAELARTFREKSQADPTRKDAAFQAAFAYDARETFPTLARPVDVIATQSSLLEPTRDAAGWLPGATLHERTDVTAPAFGDERLAALVMTLVKSAQGGGSRDGA